MIGGATRPSLLWAHGEMLPLLSDQTAGPPTRLTLQPPLRTTCRSGTLGHLRLRRTHPLPKKFAHTHRYHLRASLPDVRYRPTFHDAVLPLWPHLSKILCRAG